MGWTVRSWPKQSFGFKTYSLTLPNLSGRILLVMVE